MMRHARASRNWMPPAATAAAPAAVIASPPPREEGFSNPFKKIPLSLTLVGLCVYLFVIFSSKLGIGEIAISMALIGVFTAGKPIRLPPPLLWLGAFVVWGMFRLPSALYPITVLDGIVAWVKVWLIFLAMVNTVHGWRQLRFLCAFVLLLYLLYPVRGTLFNLAVGNGYSGRYAWNGTWGNPNDLAAFMLLPLSLALGIGLSEDSKRTRLIALTIAASFSFVIAITVSRAGFIALAFLGLVTLVRQRKGKRLRVVVTVALLSGILAVAAPQALWDRLSGLQRVATSETMQGVDPEGSAEARWGIWKIAVRIINDNLVFGVGFSCYKLFNKEYGKILPDLPFYSRGMMQTHNIFLNILAETGVVGFALYLGMMASVLAYCRRTNARLRAVAPRAAIVFGSMEVGFLAFFVAGMFGVFHYMPMLYLHLGLMYGFGEAVKQTVAVGPRRAAR